MIMMRCYIHGYLHTMKEANDIKHMMMTHEGKIVAIGDDLDLNACTEIIDLKGAHVYPGFVDAHLHLIGYGQSLKTINLHGLTSKDAIIQALKNQSTSFIYAQGYEIIGLTKHDLDNDFSDTPVVIRHSDYHGLTLNSKALSLFNITDSDGILKEEIANQVMYKLPKPTKNDLTMMLEAAIDSLYKYGITGADSDDLYYFNGFEETTSIIEHVMKHKPFRTHLLIHHRILNDFIASNKAWGKPIDYVEYGAVKMFYDGTMSSKTALMSSPYIGESHAGEVVLGRETFEQVLKGVREHGLTAAIHVIGDQGLLEVVQLLQAYPPKKGEIDRIIHAPWVTKETLKYLKTLPVSIDIQPQFLSADLPKALTYFSKKPDLVFPWKTYSQEKIIQSGSSDAPVEIPNPLLGIRDAIFRRSNHDHKQYYMDECLTPFEAIKLYSTHAQVQSKLEKRGFLDLGYLADFTILDCDLAHLSEESFSDQHVIMTIVDDHIVYKA